MILIFFEHDDGRPLRTSLEALTLAADLAARTGARVEGIALGPRAADLAGELAASPVDRLLVVDDPRLADYAPAAWAAALAEAMTARRPAVVLAGGSERGHEVLAHLGARLGLPLATNVTAVEEVAEGAAGGVSLVLTRQRWAGSLLEEARLEAQPALLTVAAHVFPVAETAAADGRPAPSVEPISVTLQEADLLVRVVEREATAVGGVSLTDARVVVGGGRGVGSAEAFALLDELAALLGGAVGVSRVVTSAGWRPHSQQIGQTGARIAPDLYIACGISGAIQHIVGCRAARKILAINTDPEAPIMSRADYAVIGDLHTVLPAIIAEIRKAQGAAA
jgi:electron transfer flavoprotein alpha subunit